MSMEVLLTVVTQLYINSFEIVIARKYLQAFLLEFQKSGKKGWLFHGMDLGLILMMTCSNILINKPLVNLAVSIIVIVILMQKYRCKFTVKLLFAALYIVISLITEFIVVFSMSFAHKGNILQGGENMQYYISIILSSIVKFIIVSQVVKMKREPIQPYSVAISQNIVLVPIISLSALLCILFLFNGNEENRYILYTVIVYAILFVNVLIYMIYDKINLLARENLEISLLEQEYHLKNEYYEKLEKNQIEIRRIRHDLKHELLIVNETIKQGEYQEALQILGETLQELDAANRGLYTENYIINAILDSKIKVAKKNEIKVVLDVKIPPKLKIQYGDIGTLFGNLLDNAIEGCIRCKKDREINIEMLYYNKSLLIRVQNSMQQKFTKLLETEKTNKLDHGFGIKNIEAVVEKYNGDIKIEAKDGIFTSEIILFQV